ncbi:hypothetical protein OJF2_09060 [Aquisphaera giovannonii]|uniref:Uncharacterized protein n=1 Tax=Aquisphaera giovannonii TaxID=406548 RepID=A0A5B9VXD2_9BACT|nr:hypothetical protein [Aquisphaera giovannonii]QEH32435.1 hypothetical protein OJF2_09060 [Aquisphaera giovannonii]
MWRHGDVFIAAVGSIPGDAARKRHVVLAEGEVTGHSHRIAEAGAAELLERDGTLYLRVLADRAKLIHQEHRAIELPRGEYRVWQQREYTPQAIRTVLD